MEKNPYIELAECLLPEEMVEYFEVVKVEKTPETLDVTLEERDTGIDGNAEGRLRPNGFYEESTVRDYPVRGRKMTFHVKRRRWVDKETGKSVYSATPEVIGQGIEQLLDQINTVNPDAKILLVSPIYLGERIWEEDFDPEFDKNSIEVSWNLPRVYEKIARRRNISYLPASEFARPGEADQEHLDELGHSRLADAIYEKLAG